MSIFYEVFAVLKANYLSLAQYATLRSALVLDESGCFEQFSNHHYRKKASMKDVKWFLKSLALLLQKAVKKVL